jgi:hypothetical protein
MVAAAVTGVLSMTVVVVQPLSERVGAENLGHMAAFQPRVCATMRGSAFVGDGAAELRALATILVEVYDAGVPGNGEER